MHTVLGFLVGAVVLLQAPLAQAQSEVLASTETFHKAQVLKVSNEHTTTVPGTGTPTRVQTLTARLLDGQNAGDIITFENDRAQLEVGDVFYARHEVQLQEHIDFWSVSDPYRLHALGALLVLLVILIFVFGGIQGVRGLASLIGSIVLIFYVLLPGVYQGYSAVWVSTAVSGIIIVVGSYITHGVNRTTSAAVVGMLATVLVTGALAWWAVDATHLTGFASDETVYLNFDTKGTIDIVGLLFGGIMIGLLGVLYDVAIGQAVTVEELRTAGAHYTTKQLYSRALRIGREHIGALINTLAIAYVGTALPLLLLIQSSTHNLSFMLNNEIFATELVRILVGSIGIILAVPITTLIATYMVRGGTRTSSSHVH